MKIKISLSRKLGLDKLNIYSFFNLRGEPIVNNQKDAFIFFLEKNKQSEKLIENYRNKFELD